MGAFSKTSIEILSSIGSSHGFSRPNRYGVSITPPNKINIENDVQSRIELNCSATNLPGRTIATLDHQTSGWLPRQMPHSEQYGQLVTNFYVSEDLLEKRFFDAWQDIIVEPTFGNLEYYDNYVGTIDIAKLDKQDNETAVYTFFEIYPVIVGDIELDYSTGDAISMLPVTFNYYSWIKKSR